MQVFSGFVKTPPLEKEIAEVTKTGDPRTQYSGFVRELARLLAVLESGVEACEHDENSRLGVLGSRFKPKIRISRQQLLTRLAVSHGASQQTTFRFGLPDEDVECCQ